METILDFIRSRQINFVLAGLLIFVYVGYQFGGLLLKQQEPSQSDLCEVEKSLRGRSRSRNRSRSPSREARASSRRRRGRCFCPNCTGDENTS